MPSSARCSCPASVHCKGLDETTRNLTPVQLYAVYAQVPGKVLFLRQSTGSSGGAKPDRSDCQVEAAAVSHGREAPMRVVHDQGFESATCASQKADEIPPPRRLPATVPHSACRCAGCACGHGWDRVAVAGRLRGRSPQAHPQRPWVGRTAHLGSAARRRRAQPTCMVERRGG